MPGKYGKKIYGGIGEEIARRELERAGYEVLESNYRGARGEVDIIARDGEVLVMVEVKARASGVYGDPEEAVDSRKARKIALTALEYLQERELGEPPVRLDVVAIILNDGAEAEVRIIPNALELGDYVRP